MKAAPLLLETPFRLELVRIPEGFCVVGFDWSKAPITGLWDLDVRAQLLTLPQRRIFMPEYLVGKYPVTNSQFRAFLKMTSYKTTSPSGAPVLWDPITLALGAPAGIPLCSIPLLTPRHPRAMMRCCITRKSPEPECHARKDPPRRRRAHPP